MKRRKKGKPKLQFTIYRGVNPLFGPGALLLEHCTDENVSRWHARGQRLQQYNYKWFFELEAQRAAHQQEITASLASIPGVSVDLSNWCRGIKYRYSDAPLSCVGSLRQSGRFNYGAEVDPARFPPFPALYAAEDRETAYREMLGAPSTERRGVLSMADLALQRHQSLVWLSLRGQVQNVFDVTKAKNLQPFVKVIKEFTISNEVRELAKELGVRPMFAAADADLLLASFMDPNWRGYPMNCDIPANSQIFGQLLCGAGFEGVLYQSIKTQSPAIAIFPRQFKNSASWISISDPPTSAHCHRIDAMNFQDCERLDWD